MYFWIHFETNNLIKTLMCYAILSIILYFPKVYDFLLETGVHEEKGQLR